MKINKGMRNGGYERALGRRKMRGIKEATADISDFVGTPIISTVILG